MNPTAPPSTAAHRSLAALLATDGGLPEPVLTVADDGGVLAAWPDRGVQVLVERCGLRVVRAMPGAEPDPDFVRRLTTLPGD